MEVILGFVDTYLRLSKDEETAYQNELEQLAPAERESVMEVRMSWRERDRQEGLQQGMLSVIMRLIERRLGPIDAGLRERISQLNPDQLNSLSDDLLDFTGPADLTKWLEAL
jgi:hypothetical protein